MSVATSEQRSSAKLSGRDLINVGVFSVLYFVIMYAFAMLGFFSPLMFGVGIVLAILANGVVVALYLSRVPKVGALTLLALFTSVLLVATGHPWYSLLLSPMIGLVADLIARAGRHRSAKLNALAYAVVSLWYLVPLSPIIWDTAGYLDTQAAAMGSDYADAWLALFGPSALPFWALGFFTVGLIGGWFGQSVLRRHFRRAGVA
jgi:energy-coupling factor transport system substrate-specific component